MRYKNKAFSTLKNSKLQIKINFIKENFRNLNPPRFSIQNSLTKLFSVLIFYSTLIFKI